MNENDVLGLAIGCWTAVQVARLIIAARQRKRAELAKAAREYRAAAKETP